MSENKKKVSAIFDIPQFYYFENGNIFTGSKNSNQFNYKIIPGDEITLQIWHGMLCSKQAKIEIEKKFAMHADGFTELIHFLEQTYRNE